MTQRTIEAGCSLLTLLMVSGALYVLTSAWSVVHNPVADTRLASVSSSVAD